MSNSEVSVVLHYESSNGVPDPRFLRTLSSVLTQPVKNAEVIIIKKSDDAFGLAEVEKLNPSPMPVQIVGCDSSTLGGQVNPAFQRSASPYILYMDNRNTQITLKHGALDIYLLTMKKYPDAGLIYTDYELEENGNVKELHLLKHHSGRLRDNQDYGRVYFIRKTALEKIGYADAALKFNTLYDLRLKLSATGEVQHIANRYAGSLYKIVAAGKAHNVFDYLLAGKDSQLEAENVLKNHLLQTGVFLESGAFYSKRPQADPGAVLKASIIIPVNNRPEFISAAIESVQAQTIREVEVIIVVNGGYNDPTIPEVKRYQPGGDKYDANKPQVQLLVYEINNLGLCLNMGAQFARGQYYVQLDSDDRLKPDAVEKILAVYDSDEKIGMVIGSYEVWKLDGGGNYSRMTELPVVTHDEWTEDNGRNNLLRINGAGAPRSLPIAIIRQIGFSMNEEPYARNYGEDYNMVLTICEKYRIGRVWDAIYEVVRHAGGTDHSIDQHTIDRNDEAKDYMRLEAVKRRKALNGK
jgi:hypothetical protein